MAKRKASEGPEDIREELRGLIREAHEAIKTIREEKRQFVKECEEAGKQLAEYLNKHSEEIIKNELDSYMVRSYDAITTTFRERELQSIHECVELMNKLMTIVEMRLAGRRDFKPFPGFISQEFPDDPETKRMIVVLGSLLDG